MSFGLTDIASAIKIAWDVYEKGFSKTQHACTYLAYSVMDDAGSDTSKRLSTPHLASTFENSRRTLKECGRPSKMPLPLVARFLSIAINNGISAP
jgi:hypothetical protein